MKKIYFWIIRHIPRPVLIIFSYVFRKFSGILYMGNNVECPVCGGHFRKMLPYGVWENRDNALCPKCLSLERHRLMWLFLKERTDLFISSKKVLHVAPEQCFRERFKKMENLEYVTADMVSPIADVKMDVQDMPFGDNEFDVVICNHVLEHVPDDKKALSEIKRVMKPDGYAIVFVPIDFNRKHTYEDPSITDPLEREKHFHQKDHLRLYGKDFVDIVVKEGFKVDAKNYTEELDIEAKKRYCVEIDEYMFAYKK